MKTTIYLFLFLLFAFYACKNASTPGSKPENNVDAARDFIRAALDGKFDEARGYMLPDSVNLNYMDVAERNYEKADMDTKNGYRAASIRILNVTEPIKDSVTIVIYSNSFKNDPDTLKVLKKKGTWLIDLKYLYEHDRDTTLPMNNINRDPLK